MGVEAKTMKNVVRLIESGLVPDALIRMGIRALNRKRLRMENPGCAEVLQERKHIFIEQLRKDPIAVHADAANRQHYELPPEFFRLILGKHRKYSCCLYTEGTESLNDAEENMLALTCERARLQDGMDILELGCGWGSLTLWMGEHYPNSRITTVSNSLLQGEFIRSEALKRGISNISVITSDMNIFTADKSFDRIVSVEMFEHMRNYERLLYNISTWMKPDGLLFVHIFCHQDYAYFFETEGEDNWMGKYFFTGGIMPSDDLLVYFHDDVILQDHWRINGIHYQRTAEDWLRNLDRNKAQVKQILEATYGRESANLWFQRWRIFLMACSELWGFRRGQEWWVAHYLFRPRR
jgi:cyclopropane-fatty-acyl-phospholipid synthase